MKLRREGIAAHDDARDLIARRQTPAGEAVDANHRARTGDLLEHPLQLFLVVGQLIDLRLTQRLRQAAGLGFCSVADTVTSVSMLASAIATVTWCVGTRGRNRDLDFRRSQSLAR